MSEKEKKKIPLRDLIPPKIIIDDLSEEVNKKLDKNGDLKWSFLEEEGS